MNKLRKKQVWQLLIHTIIFGIVFVIIWTQIPGPPQDHELVPEGWSLPDYRVFYSLILLMYYLFAVVGTFVVPKNILNCPNCGWDIPRYENKCPHCGFSYIK